MKKGFAVGLQGQAIVAGQVGWGFGKVGGLFWEAGVGWFPGVALTGYYVFPPFLKSGKGGSGEGY